MSLEDDLFRKPVQKRSQTTAFWVDDAVPFTLVNRHECTCAYQNGGNKGKAPLLPTAVREGSPRNIDRIREKNRAGKKNQHARKLTFNSIQYLGI